MRHTGSSLHREGSFISEPGLSSCSTQLSLPHDMLALSSLTRDQTRSPCKVYSEPLDEQGSPCLHFLTQLVFWALGMEVSLRKPRTLPEVSEDPLGLQGPVWCWYTPTALGQGGSPSLIICPIIFCVLLGPSFSRAFSSVSFRQRSRADWMAQASQKPAQDLFCTLQEESSTFLGGGTSWKSKQTVMASETRRTDTHTPHRGTDPQRGALSLPDQVSAS